MEFRCSGVQLTLSVGLFAGIREVKASQDAIRVTKIGGWGWKRSGAEIPTRNPSPAPIATAPHARHDRSMARSISVAMEKLGGFPSFPSLHEKRPESVACPERHFVHFSKELQWFSLGRFTLCLGHVIKI